MSDPASDSEQQLSSEDEEQEEIAQQVVAAGQVQGFAFQPENEGGRGTDMDWIPDLDHFFNRVVRVNENSWWVSL